MDETWTGSAEPPFGKESPHSIEAPFVDQAGSILRLRRTGFACSKKTGFLSWTSTRYAWKTSLPDYQGETDMGTALLPNIVFFHPVATGMRSMVLTSRFQEHTSFLGERQSSDVPHRTAPRSHEGVCELSVGREIHERTNHALTSSLESRGHDLHDPRRTARSTSTVTELFKAGLLEAATVTHNMGCQRDSCTFRCKAFEIALSKEYRGNALSFGVGVSIPVRSDSRGGSNTRHCSLVLQENW